MKKLIILFIGVISMSNTNAQDIQDAVRYSQDEILGTARFRAMSGAFGALGGDMSAVSINPAGAAVFNNSHASITLLTTNVDNDVSYFGETNNSSDSTFDLNQTGAAFVFNTRGNSNWKKFVLSLAYDKTQNFSDNWFASGVNNRSIDSYFLANAQGLRLDEISAFTGESTTDAYDNIGAAFGYQNQQAFLGFESFILEPDADTDENTTYTSNIASGTFDQEYSYAATGYNGKFSFNIATQYKDNLYFGLNLNSHVINYERSTFLFEGNNNAGSLVNEVGFENTLSTLGSGFSFQLGGIAKLSDQVRVGLTYNSPTWLTITEETTQRLRTLLDTGDVINLNPQIVNVFEDYRIQTPAKVTGSAALVVDKKGLISLDYSRKNYGNIKFRPENDEFFANQNNGISNNLKDASSYKIGGEYRHKNFSFRGGYRFEESPYNNSEIVGDLTGYSLGLGYNFGNTKLDLAFDQNKRDTDYQLFNVGLTDRASINATNTNVLLSLSFNL